MPSPAALAALALAAAVLAAGCAQSPAPEPAAPAAPPPAPPAPVAFACPAGDTVQRDGLCVRVLDLAPEGLAEPFVAVHPSDPQVIAVGAQVARAAGAADAAPPQAGAYPVGTEVFVTEDGGATWRRSQLPAAGATGLAGAQAGVVVDAALAFAPDGTLHATSLVQGAVPAEAPAAAPTSLPFNEVVHSRSADLGRTWSAPVRLSQGDGSADRNWVAVDPAGRVVALWQAFRHGNSTAAWSVDGGATWRSMALGPGCTQVSQPAFPPQGMVVLCTYAENGPQDVHAWHVDLAAGTAERGPALGLPCYFAGLAWHGERLAGACAAEDRLRVAVSGDGGRTWAAPIDLREAWGLAGQMQALAMDPAGRLHVLTQDGATAAHAVGGPGGELERMVRWVQAPQAARRYVVPDHYWGLDVAGSLGAAAVTDGEALLVYRVAQ